MLKVVKFFLIIILIPKSIESEIFSSIEGLQRLAINEKTLLQELELYATQVDDEYIYR